MGNKPLAKGTPLNMPAQGIEDEELNCWCTLQRFLTPSSFALLPKLSLLLATYIQTGRCSCIARRLMIGFACQQEERSQ